jgi:hypothetical protein
MISLAGEWMNAEQCNWQYAMMNSQLTTVNAESRSATGGRTKTLLLYHTAHLSHAWPDSDLMHEPQLCNGSQPNHS